jgi:hypothetical protein
MQQSISLESNFVESLKLEFDTANIKEAIYKLYQAYQELRPSLHGFELDISEDRVLIEKNTKSVADDIINGIRDIKEGKTRNIEKLFDEL